MTEPTLDSAFAALSHPVRRAIIAQLAKGEASVNTLAAPHDMSLPAISRHIKVLEEAGFIQRGRDAQFRPCTLDAAPLQAIDTWTAQYRAIWAGRFDALDQALATLQTGERDNGK